MIQKSKLAATIKRLAAEQNVSIAVLERHAGCSQGLVSRWAASGGEEFSVVSKLVTMAEFLNVSFDELLGREVPSQQRPDTIANSIHRLVEMTRSNLVQWHRLGTGDTFQIDVDELPPCESGRMFSDGWWLQADDCFFVLAAYCDDQSDTSEPMDLVVYYVIGHGIPVYPLPIADLTELQSLYIQLRIQKALDTATTQATEMIKTALPSKTIDFGRVVRQG